MRNIRIPQVFTLILPQVFTLIQEIKNYCLHGTYLLFHNKSDTLHYLFAIPSAFTLSRELEL